MRINVSVGDGMGLPIPQRAGERSRQASTLLVDIES